MKVCKYYNKHLKTIKEYIHCLYGLEGCSCGGLCHIVVDDGNYDNNSLSWVLNECEKEENKNREELEITKLICNELLKLSINERALLLELPYRDFIF